MQSKCVGGSYADRFRFGLTTSLPFSQETCDILYVYVLLLHTPENLIRTQTAPRVYRLYFKANGTFNLHRRDKLPVQFLANFFENFILSSELVAPLEQRKVVQKLLVSKQLEKFVDAV